MDIAVSIIIPIYNAESFLSKGLDSCVNQTLPNIEIICVNDASTDNTSALIKKYVDRYPDKVIQIELTSNSGQGGARNRGILSARGEYLCFMDSDDYLDIHLCEDVYKEAKRHDADIVFYDYIRVEGEKQYPVEFIGEEDKDLWYLHPVYAVWLQLIRREVITRYSLFSPENIRAADAAITPLWKYYAGKSYKINRPYYYYVNRPESLVNGNDFLAVATSITGVIPYRHCMMQKTGLLEKYSREAGLMMARDISSTLVRLLKLKKLLTIEEISYMRRSLNGMDKYILDESLIKYCLPRANIDMIRSFFYSPEDFLGKYPNYTSFKMLQINQGMDYSIEPDIKSILLMLKQNYGSDMVIWGAGTQGGYIISTLLRMGYNFWVFDNARHGMEVWEGANKKIHAFEEMKDKKADVVLVTSDIYYKVIENQIHQKYPETRVVNFPRLIRDRAGGYGNS